MGIQFWNLKITVWLRSLGTTASMRYRKKKNRSKGKQIPINQCPDSKWSQISMPRKWLRQLPWAISQVLYQEKHQVQEDPSCFLRTEQWHELPGLGEAGSRAAHREAPQSTPAPSGHSPSSVFPGQRTSRPRSLQTFQKPHGAWWELLNLVHALAYLSAGQVGLLPEQPGLGHTVASLENWWTSKTAQESREWECGQVTGQLGWVLPSSGSCLHKLPSPSPRTCSLSTYQRELHIATSTSHIKNRWN